MCYKVRKYLVEQISLILDIWNSQAHGNVRLGAIHLGIISIQTVVKAMGEYEIVWDS